MAHENNPDYMQPIRNPDKFILPYCPHCGCNGYFINGSMRGSVETYYDESGNHEETNLDRAYWESQSKVVRCANCTKIRRDVRLIDGHIMFDYNRPGACGGEE